MLDNRPADRVLVRSGPHAGIRGVITAVRGDKRTAVVLPQLGGKVYVRLEQIRNFSAAARKAWKTMPKRNVGRPAGKSVERVTVSLRIESSLWNRFKALEKSGRISGRSAFIEEFLNAKLQELRDK